MIYYLIPGTELYGGVKKAVHYIDHLNASGHPCTGVSPDGSRPTWFAHNASFIHMDKLPNCITEDDTIIFTFPPQAHFVDQIRCRRKVLHFQEITDRMWELFTPQHQFETITCGDAMHKAVTDRGFKATNVPQGIPDIFRFRGGRKRTFSVAVMPRKGSEYIRFLQRGLTPRARLYYIHGRHEEEVAAILKLTDVFVAISPDEHFGLPPLEAMAAGCAVVGFPGQGGSEYMAHGETAHVVENGNTTELTRALTQVLRDINYRQTLRIGGMHIASRYTMGRERDSLVKALFPK